MIIGVAGTFGSGKDTAASYIEEKYKLLHVSTSNLVREIALKTRGSIERPILYEVASELRRDYGSSVLVDKAFAIYVEQKNKYQGLVVSGIRSAGEAQAILSRSGKLIFIDGDSEIRYLRMLERARDLEIKLTREEFQKQQDKERNDSLDYNFNLEKVREMSSITIFNNKDLASFQSQIDQFLNKKA